MSKHTPGPWITDNHYAHKYGARTYLPVMRPGNDPIPIAVVHRDTDRYGREEGEANARLIVAAPDLLEMTKLFELSLVYMIKKDKFEGDNEGAGLKTITLNLVRAAIAKAEGR